MATFPEAIAAWTLHYEADLDAARNRAVELRKHVPDDRRAELAGACLALTPAEHRCAHYGDRRNCAQCLTDPEDQ
jgi:hypothetical protein